MNLRDKIFSYLQEKIPNFVKSRKKGADLFSCPNSEQHRIKDSNPTAIFMNGGDKIVCLRCNWKGNFNDVVRLLEKDKSNFTDEQIMEYLMGRYEVENYKELEQYIKYGWSLTPLVHNTRDAFEPDWRNVEHKDISNWIKWLQQGWNIGLNCELSKVMTVDVDCKKPVPKELEETRGEIIKLLLQSNTLQAFTPSGGFHFVYQWDEELRKQRTNISLLQIDTRTEGQIAIAPSIRNGISYRWKNLGSEIKVIPAEVKIKLLELIKTEKKNDIAIPENAVNILKEGEGRNSKLLSIGGGLIKKFNIEDTAYILSLISHNFFNPPLPSHEIKAMLGSLDSYQQSEEQTQKQKILEYFKVLRKSVRATDILLGTFPEDKHKIHIINKYLSEWVKEGKAIRVGRGCFDYKEKVEWTTESPEAGQILPYKVPFLEEVAYFQHGDMIVLGGSSGVGKTHISLNIIRELKESGIIPYYISKETGSRCYPIAETLKLAYFQCPSCQTKFYNNHSSENRDFYTKKIICEACKKDMEYKTDFYVSKQPIDNPLEIEIEPQSFTIIDWLYINDFAKTQEVFDSLNKEMRHKGGILVVFTQLKETSEWFAENLVKSFASIAGRYEYTNIEGTAGKFTLDKIRDPKGNHKSHIIPCVFDFETKIFKKKETI